MRALRLLARLAAGLILGLALVACVLHVANSGQADIPDPPPGTLRVATLNVHYIRLREAEGPWSVGDWEARKPALDAAFKAVSADIFAFQEMESFGRGDLSPLNLARDYLLEQNPGYAAAASGDPAEFPSTQPIFYRTDRLELLDQGWFFFSETPEMIYSRTFDGSWPAFASWARFEPRTGGPEFTVLNVHLEHRSGANRLRSAALIAERLAPMVEAGPVVLTADLNAWLGSRTVALLEAADLDFAPVRGATYHFDRGINVLGAIDHVAATPDVTFAGPPVVLRRRFAGDWPSDHYPVLVDLRLP